MRICSSLAAAALLTTPGFVLPVAAQDAKEAEAKARQLQEAFQKGPITLQAKVTRKVDGADRVLPLFQVPILQAGDRLQLAFSGEAFDRRVTRADWSVVVVFLPRTVAPTEQGVVDGRLKAGKDGRMELQELVAPYDAAPLIFLVPDSGGRKKILTDLNSHLESFRAICLKITDLSEARAHADRFLKGLAALDRNQNPAEYDSSVLNFLNLYGDWVSKDLQLLLNKQGSNLEKYQLLAQEFRRAAVLVPAMQADQIVKVELPQVVATSPASAYVAIAFDLAKMFQNLWPGHKFRYTPALARDFRGMEADLYYGEWIRTTGDPRGAMVCSPCRWEDATPPAFEFSLQPDASLLQPNVLLTVQVKSQGLSPFALYGHEWQLTFTEPGLPPLDLTPSPGRKGFVVNPGPALELLRTRGLRTVMARIQGRWGHQVVQSDPARLVLDADPAWQPTESERERFQAGGAAAFRLPAPWAACVARVIFRPKDSSLKPLAATLRALEDGSRLAEFSLREVEAAEGTLEVHVHGRDLPTLARPLTLMGASPVVEDLSVHRGERQLQVTGKGLQAIVALQAGGRTFRQEGNAWMGDGGVEGQPGTLVPVTALLRDGRLMPLKGLQVLPPRPRLAEPELLPLAPAADRMVILSRTPVAAASQSLRVALQAGEGTRFALGRPPRVQVRNPEDAADVRTLTPAQVQVLGHGQRLIATFVPGELLPGKATGHLEVRLQDDRLGASAWRPLPVTLLDLPQLTGLVLRPDGAWITGQGLELVEAFSAAAAGPWEKPHLAFLDAQPAARVPQPGAEGLMHFRLFGWPDLVLWVQGPIPPKPEPLRPVEPAKGATPAPGAATQGATAGAQAQGPAAPKATVESVREGEPAKGVVPAAAAAATPPAREVTNTGQAQGAVPPKVAVEPLREGEAPKGVPPVSGAAAASPAREGTVGAQAR